MDQNYNDDKNIIPQFIRVPITHVKSVNPTCPVIGRRVTIADKMLLAFFLLGLARQRHQIPI